VILVVAVTLGRVVELAVAAHNTALLRARGAVEHGAGHYPVMVVLHAGLLFGAAFERSGPGTAWGLVGVVVAQALRWWCIATLGRRWTTRVLVLPGAPRVVTGPYRWLRHPNYVAVALEGLALPAFTGAWGTAVVFGVANALLLLTRIRVEDAALGAR
jgi:methyltransferase